jgi:protocatechuate 3,4-dioxygenase beta subunit
MKTYITALTIILALCLAAPSQAQSPDPFVPPKNTDVAQMARTFPQLIAPKDGPATVIVAPPDEPGQRLIVSGRVTDGKVPMPGVSIYIYHADARGCYPADCLDHGPHTFSARLHGAMRTDALGRYSYETIRPLGYGGGEAHVHCIVATGEPTGWQFEMTFADDPVVVAVRNGTRATPAYYADGVVSIRPATKDAKGVWHVTQDIVLSD